MKLRKTSLYLFLIVVLALILRIVVAYNTDVGTDEMVYSLLPLGIIGSGQLNTIEGVSVFLYITDIGYKLFGGITAISARFTAIIFGAFVSIVIFLIALELFDDKKAALISAFLFAVSSFALSYNIEMDMIAYFFALLSMLFFMKSLKVYGYLCLSILFLVIGALSKPIVLVLVIPFALVFILNYILQPHHYTNDRILKIDKHLLKVLILAFVIAIIAASPVLVYNYFTYIQSGTTDYYFASILGVGEYPLKGVSQQVWSFQKLTSISTSILLYFLKHDTVLIFFGLLGSILFFRKKLLHSLMLWLAALFILFYVAGKAGGGQHHLLLPAVFSIFGSLALLRSGHWVKEKFSFRYFIPIVLVIALVFSIVTLHSAIRLRDSATTLVLRDFVVNTIEDDAIVVTDPRIFTGVHAWVFNDRSYISGIDFVQYMTSLGPLPEEQRILAPIYYLECDPVTYCGWKPEDFNRIAEAGEQITLQFKQITDKVADINTDHHFVVHKAFMQVPIDIYRVIDEGKMFWGYPIGWKSPERAIDHYEAEGFGKFLNSLGLIVLYIDVSLALLSILFVIYLVIKQK